MNLSKYLQLLPELTYLSLNKLTRKYGKRIALAFLYTLYKAQIMSDSPFLHSFTAVFPFSFGSNATNSFIFFFKQVCFEKKLLIHYKYIYLLNACKLD